MTDASLVCPQCGLAVRVGPPEKLARLARDPELRTTLYYACPEHGAVDPLYPRPQPADLNIPGKPAA